MGFADVRRLFPGAAQRVFLDAAAMSLTSTPAADAVARYAELVTRDPRAALRGGDAARAREAAARLIGARPEQIALSPATTLALNVAADAVPVRRGDNVVTCDLFRSSAGATGRPRARCRFRKAGARGRAAESASVARYGSWPSAWW